MRESARVEERVIEIRCACRELLWGPTLYALQHRDFCSIRMSPYRPSCAKMSNQAILEAARRAPGCQDSRAPRAQHRHPAAPGRRRDSAARPAPLRRRCDSPHATLSTHNKPACRRTMGDFKREVADAAEAHKLIVLEAESEKVGGVLTGLGA